MHSKIVGVQKGLYKIIVSKEVNVVEKYTKPEVQVVEFVSENIAEGGSGSDSTPEVEI